MAKRPFPWILAALLVVACREDEPPGTVRQELAPAPGHAADTARPPTADEGAPRAVVAGVGRALRVTRTHCPRPFQLGGVDPADGNTRCVLPRDATLAEALVLSSGVTLECRGRTLAPVDRGVPCRTYGGNCATNGSAPSNPEVAVVIDQATGAKVRRCDLQGFDFGVLVMSSEGASVVSSTIGANYRAVTLLHSSGSRVEGNTLVTAGGKVVQLMGDSDRNLIAGNRITNSGRLLLEPYLPGGARLGGATVQAGIAGGELAPLLVNLRIGDTFRQLPRAFPLPWPEDNVYLDNTIELTVPPMPGLPQQHGVTDVTSRRLRIEGNTIGASDWGADVNGFGALTAFGFPTTCSLDPGYGCFTDEDCGAAGKGACGRTCGIAAAGAEPRACETAADCAAGVTCTPGARRYLVDVQSRDVRMTANHFRGPFSIQGIHLMATHDLVFERNVMNAQGAWNGLHMMTNVLESSTVVRNRITGGNFSIKFSGAVPGTTVFGARFAQNDFLAPEVKSIDVVSNYNLRPTELSWNGRGNHWGRACSDEGGFKKNTNTTIVANNAVYFARDGVTGWVAGANGEIRATTDGGVTWVKQGSGTIQRLNGMSFVEDATGLTGWVVGDAGVVRKYEGGAWKAIPVSALPSGTTRNLYRVHFSDAKHGWVIGGIDMAAATVILKTTDGGERWTDVTPAFAEHAVRLGGATLNGVHFVNDKTGWVTGSHRVYKTTDGGVTWRVVLEQGAGDVFFVDALNGWAAARYVLRTIDGGETWAAIDAGTRFAVADLHFTDARHGWSVGAAGHISRTTDGGVTWTVEPQPLGTLAILGVHAVAEPGCAGEAGCGRIAWAVADVAVLKTPSPGDGAGWFSVASFGVPGADSPVEWIRDSHAYGVPVSDTPEAALPDPCP
jgi:photosystem II stability/assembly factor-like uncharacterized protein/nitrous oxidase accessory protein NosD